MSFYPFPKKTIRCWASALLTVLLLSVWQPVNAQFPQPGARGANIRRIPSKILLTGTDLSDKHLSLNAMQLAEQLGLTPLLSQAQELNAKLESGTLSGQDSLLARVELMELKQKAIEIIQKTELEVDFVLAEIMDEQNLYSELQASFLAKRDRKIATISAIGFGVNGSLWTLAAALAIPTWRRPKLSVPGGDHRHSGSCYPLHYFGIRAQGGFRRALLGPC